MVFTANGIIYINKLEGDNAQKVRDQFKNFRELGEIKKLNLDSNFISKLPASFDWLTSLIESPYLRETLPAAEFGNKLHSLILGKLLGAEVDITKSSGGSGEDRIISVKHGHHKNCENTVNTMFHYGSFRSNTKDGKTTILDVPVEDIVLVIQHLEQIKTLKEEIGASDITINRGDDNKMIMVVATDGPNNGIYKRLLELVGDQGAVRKTDKDIEMEFNSLIKVFDFLDQERGSVKKESSAGSSNLKSPTRSPSSPDFRGLNISQGSKSCQVL